MNGNIVRIGGISKEINNSFSINFYINGAQIKVFAESKPISMGLQLDNETRSDSDVP